MILVCGLLLSACGGGSKGPPLATIDAFDANRYLGSWYEIGSIPAWFQKDCVADTTATYSLDDKGRLNVLNQCREADGRLDSADGKARFTDPQSPGKLEVTFVSLLGGWFWMAAGDYWIMALDADYQWSLVGNPSRDYAWILARDKTVAPALLRQLHDMLRNAAYDPCRLIITSDDQAEDNPTLCAYVETAP